ncbi:MAG: erythromycin biosynthesis sensory transduction protein eryC1 [Acidobacteria bacterium]|nr:MAG: erythromycin biosynthesis sensory transduction protein eryC1 [Acidobacteriota bacterium]
MIPLVDLKAQYADIKSEIGEAIEMVLDSGQFILGNEVAAFETEFASYCQASYAVALNSGTSALHLALLAANIGPGDEVITVPFTFIATVAAILYVGARAVFVDINPRSYTIDLDQLEAAITNRTKAIIPVHLYGQPADIDPIQDLAKRKGLVVIEDAAQAHGAEYKGRRVGSIGDIACFSFYPGKNLGAYGEGGAFVTNNNDYARAARMLRDWGQERKYHHVIKGYNYRMDGIQGAILRVKLRHLELWTEARRQNARYYNAMLEGSPVILPVEMPYARHVFHVYAVRTSHRNIVQQALDAQGIQTGIHYPIPVHLQKAYAETGYRLGDFPHAERAANEVLSLPMYAELSNEQIETVSAAIRGALNARTA